MQQKIISIVFIYQRTYEPRADEGVRLNGRRSIFNLKVVQEDREDVN